MSELSPFYADLRPESEGLALIEKLRHCRGAVRARVADVDDELAQARPLSNTSMCLGGVVKHLAWVEDRWFTGKFVGADLPEPWRSAPIADQPDWALDSAQFDPVGTVVVLYETAVARSERAIENRLPDSLAAVDSFGNGPVSLRWLLLHMTSETAWHLGHLDLLRDGLRLPPAQG